MKKSILLLSALIISSIHIYAKDDINLSFSPDTDEDTGLVGIKYRDETVLLPRFDEVSLSWEVKNLSTSDNFKWRNNSTTSSIFSYRDGNKWGVGSLFGEITHPVYDEIRLISHSELPYIITKIGEKYGINSLQGIELAPHLFDDISSPIEIRSDYNYIEYFIAKKDGETIVIDITGRKVTDAEGFEDLSKDDRQKFLIKAEKIEKKNNENNIGHLEEIQLKIKNSFKGEVPYVSFGFKRNKSIENGYDVYKSEIYCKMKPILLADGKWLLICGNYIGDLDNTYEYKSLYYSPFYMTTYASTYFIYGKDGKWGLRDHEKNFTEPIYDKMRAINNRWIEVSQNGKIGMINMFGKTLIPAEYCLISRITDISSGYKYVYASYFNCSYGDGTSDVYDEWGNKLVSKCKSKKVKKEAEKEAKKFTTAHPDFVEKYLDTQKKQNKYSSDYLVQIDGMETSHTVKLEYPNSKHKFGVLTDFGFITTPIKVNSRKWVLARNPGCLPALVEQGNDMLSSIRYHRFIHTDNIDDAIESYKKYCEAKTQYEYLAKISQKAGFDGTTLENIIKNKIEYIETVISYYEKEIESTQKTIAFNQKLDAISNSTLQVLNQAMQIYSDMSNDTSAYNENSNSTNLSNDKGVKRNEISDKYDVRGQQNCNVAKRSYDNYESQLMKMQTYPEKYDERQKQQIQNKMKSLREKWTAKGFEMRYSDLEDW